MKVVCKHGILKTKRKKKKNKMKWNGKKIVAKTHTLNPSFRQCKAYPSFKQCKACEKIRHIEEDCWKIPLEKHPNNFKGRKLGELDCSSQKVDSNSNLEEMVIVTTLNREVAMVGCFQQEDKDRVVSVVMILVHDSYVLIFNTLCCVILLY